MTKTVQAQHCNKNIALRNNIGYHNNNDSRGSYVLEERVCKQKTALDMVKKTYNRSLPPWLEPLHSAQAEDYMELKGEVHESLAKTQEGLENMNTRIFNLESTVSEIKDTMVTKEDLKELKDELIPAIKDAAKYDVVKNTVTINWRGVLLFFGAVVLASFGVRGLDFLSKLMEKLL